MNGGGTAVEPLRESARVERCTQHAADPDVVDLLRMHIYFMASAARLCIFSQQARRAAARARARAQPHELKHEL